MPVSATVQTKGSATLALTSLVRIRSFFSLEEKPGRQVLWPLFLVSFTSLYLEILLIRWIGTEVRLFAYFQNLTLIACFLGFGLGCYRAAEKKSQLFDATSAGLLVILASIPAKPWKHLLEVLSSGLAFSPDAVIWAGNPFSRGSQLTALFALCVVVVAAFLLLIIASMIPVGQWVGHYLNAAGRNIVSAYSINLLGSLVGVWLLAGMSALRLQPFYWFGFAFLVYFLMQNPARKFEHLGIILAAIALALLFQSGPLNRWTSWSPYQKLEIDPAPEQQYNVLVNNTGYMTIANVTPAFLAAHPDFAAQYQFSSYDAPFRFLAKRERVLIVGAGAGNDVAAALRNGVRDVDAVEIDPVIYSIGKRLHPEHPYDSPHVHVIFDDARSYLRRSTQHYDAVIFGLLDSHTQFSGYSNMRIDNYVYTEQSLAEAKHLLNSSGVLIVKFGIISPWTWIGQRFYATFDELFGRPPVVFYARQIGGLILATEFIASNDSGAWDRAAQPPMAEYIQANPPEFPRTTSGAPPPVTDDWPYIYHRSHAIPRAYLTVSLILFVIAILFTRRGFQARRTSTWSFFFLGAGFLLLETQLISRLALYFGSTWIVNCIALSAILIVLIAANLFVQHAPGRSLTIPYILLVLSLLGIYFFRWDSLPFGTRSVGVLLAAAYCLPLFFAGMIFAESLRRFENKSNAFGSNIIGAVAGGLAQNLSFIMGLKALLLLAVAFYLLAAVFYALNFKRESSSIKFQELPL